MTDKTQRTIRIKWLRSGIGFTYRQKEMIRSLGLRRLNQVVERPDSPQIRGLVARIPHLVAVLDEAPKAEAWASLAEYTLRPPEVAPAEPPAPAVEAAVPSEASHDEASTAPQIEVKTGPVKAAVEAAEEMPAPAKGAKGAKPAKTPAAEKGKAAGKAGKKAEKKKAKAGAAKSTKPSKSSKK